MASSAPALLPLQQTTFIRGPVRHTIGRSVCCRPFAHTGLFIADERLMCSPGSVVKGGGRSIARLHR